MVVTVPKITEQVHGMGVVIKPDTSATVWRVIEERETEFVIEIFN